MFTVWKHKAFPNWKRVWIHLSTVWQIWQTMRHLTNQSMIPEYGIMEQRHQRHVSRLCPSFPLPSPPLSSLCLPNFFLPYTLSPMRSQVPPSVYQGKEFFFVWHFIHILPQIDPSKDQKPWTSNTQSQQCMQIPSWWSQKCLCNSHIWICCKKRKS